MINALLWVRMIVRRISLYSCYLSHFQSGDPNGIRTRVTAVKGQCPNRWTIGSREKSRSVLWHNTMFAREISALTQEPLNPGAGVRRSIAISQLQEQRRRTRSGALMAFERLVDVPRHFLPEFRL